jgi:hypothetical protein
MPKLAAPPPVPASSFAVGTPELNPLLGELELRLMFAHADAPPMSTPNATSRARRREEGEDEG